ncbi:ATP-binding protein [Paraconexibacter sp. AEG42_29]|uniref:hybrid sensor histidine kinase/response regulator n=1 Tax=Paraconexibacter sp. AEG42_29 TaxID=2997339 RepID=UPI00339D48D8
MDGGPGLRWGTATLGVAVIYGALAYLGYQLTVEDTFAEASAVWPAVGFAIVSLLFLGRPALIGIVMGGTAADLLTGAQFGESLAIGLVSAVNAAIIRELFLEFELRVDLQRLRDVAGLVLIGTLVAPIGATLGTAVIALNHEEAGELGLTWLAWWAGDVSGLMLVGVPLLLLVAHVRGRALPGHTRRHEPALLVVLAAGTAALIFFAQDAPIAYLALPVVVWTAARGSLTLIGIVTIVMGSVASAATLADVGPFAGLDLTQRLIVLDVFGGCVAMTGLILGTLAGERRSALAAVQGSAAVLERRVAERTAELDQARRLAESRERAEAAFLANVTHEIRTPLHAVIGTTRVLADTTLDHEQRDLVGVVSTSGEHMLTITNDVLDFSKIEAGAIELERVPFSLHAAVEDTVALLGPAALGKGLELAILVQEPLHDAVSGDVARLRQVLLNLLANAVKFTPTGEIVVSVATEASGDGAVRVLVDVRDTGIGIAADRLPSLFERFVQGETSTSRRYGGTGLGLAISRELVTLMGGRLTVRSTQGEGTTFALDVRLDAEPQPAPDEALPAPPRTAAVIVASPGLHEQFVRELGRLGIAVVAQDAPADLVIAEDAARGRALAGASTPLVMLVPTASVSVEGAERIVKPPRRRAIERAVARSLRSEVAELEPARIDDGMAARHPLRILIADDMSVGRLVTTRVLRRLGYEADAVADGQEAVDVVLRQDYDVVLMDVRMPRLDGLQATRQIIARAAHGRRPVILGISAGADDEQQACLVAGMDGVIGKPLILERLRDALLLVRTRSTPS